MTRNIIFSLLIFSLLVSISWAQESTLSITDMKAIPNAVSSGDRVLISCRVTHSNGSTFIERVTATVFHGKWTTQYSMLYDDGTHGDKIAEDGIYSLEIKASDTALKQKIVFQATDKDKFEIESEPVILTVK